MILRNFVNLDKLMTKKLNEQQIKAAYILLAVLSLLSCKKHNDGVRPDNEVWLHNQYIEPYQLSISKGTTITFINKDPKTHTVSEISKKFYSGKLGPGDSYSFTFSDTGYYAFFCNYHNSMLGQIVVK